MGGPGCCCLRRRAQGYFIPCAIAVSDAERGNEVRGTVRERLKAIAKARFNSARRPVHTNRFPPRILSGLFYAPKALFNTAFQKLRCRFTRCLKRTDPRFFMRRRRSSHEALHGSFDAISPRRVSPSTRAGGHTAFSEKLARRGRRRPGRTRTTVLCVAIAGVVLSSAALAQRSARYRAARGEYEALRTAYRADAVVAEQTVPSSQPAGSGALADDGDNASQISLFVSAASPRAAIPSATQIPYANAAMAALRARNPRAEGWITIPGTPVDYPILRGEDNTWYLNHDFDDSKDPGGAIFMDHRNTADWDDFVTVVYGHNMKDGSMFRSLREYLKPGYFRAHREIRVTGLYQEWRYRVFAVFRCPASHDMVPYNALADDHRQELLYDVHARSQVNKGALGWPKPDDRLLALVTCDTGNDDSFIAVLAVRL